MNRTSSELLDQYKIEYERVLEAYDELLWSQTGLPGEDALFAVLNCKIERIDTLIWLHSYLKDSGNKRNRGKLF